MPVVHHKIHGHGETDPEKLKIIRRRFFANWKSIGFAWSIPGNDRDEPVIECDSKITALETDFTFQEFADFCELLRAWYKTKTLFGGRKCVMVFPVPNASHKRYYAPAAVVPMAYPLDNVDPHYGVPRNQFESMKPEPLGRSPCTFLTEGRRWFNALAHPIGESFRWGRGGVLWDRSNLLWLFDYCPNEHQLNELWNHSLTILNLGMERRKISGLEIDRQDAAFLLAVKKAQVHRNKYV